MRSRCIEMYFYDFQPLKEVMPCITDLWSPLGFSLIIEKKLAIRSKSEQMKKLNILWLIIIYIWHQQRTIAWFGLERTSKIIKFQTPCHGQVHPPPDQIVQKPTQPGLEHCQGCNFHNFFGQPVPGPPHHHNTEFLPKVYCKSTLFQLKAIIPHPATTCTCKNTPSSHYAGLP